MGIKVEHGSDFGSAGQILAQSGIASLNRTQRSVDQANQLQAMKERTQMQIDAQADRQKQASEHAFEIAAMRGGLQEQLVQQKFENEIEGAKEAAKQQAGMWEYKFTGKQRMDMARAEADHQRIQKSDLFTPEEKKTEARQYMLGRASNEPSAVPVNPNVEKFAEGKPKDGTWTNESGDVMGWGVERNGDRVPTRITAFKDTPKGAELKHNQAIELAKMKDRQAVWSTLVKKKTTTAAGISESEVFMDPKLIASHIHAMDKFEADEAAAATKAESDAAAARQKQENDMLGPPQNAPQQRTMPDAFKPLAVLGLTMTPEEQQMPGDLGYAQFTYRAMKLKYGSFGNVPPEMKPIFVEAVKKLRKHYATKQ